MAMPKQPQRELAKAAGESTYFTGKPCKHGHIARRNVSDMSCVACREVFRTGYREEARQYAQARRDDAMAADPAGTRARWAADQRRLRLEFPERYRALDRKHGRLKRQRNPAAKLAETRKRQAEQLKRTPAWADLRAIRAFYAACPAGCEVDHAVPLRGKTVSGLHVLENLQYLTKEQNRAKGCSFDA